MNKLTLKPYIYTALIGGALGLGACQKENKSHIEEHYTTLPDTFERSHNITSAPIFGDTLLVFDDVKVPKRIRHNAKGKEIMDEFKKLYPEDKYIYNHGNFEKYDYPIISIIDKNTMENFIRIAFFEEQNGNGFEEIHISTSKNGKYSRFSYNEVGEIKSLNVSGENELYSPLVEDICKALNEKNFLGMHVTSKNLLPNIQKITPNSITQIDDDFIVKMKDKNGLLGLIEKSTWLDNDVKTKCLKHLDYCYSKNIGYKESFDIEESQIINKYYTGDKYTKEQKDGILTVKNLRTGRITCLNMDETFKNLNVRNKNIAKVFVQNLPAEILEDVAIEIGNQFYQGDANDAKAFSKAVFGYYNSAKNIVKILRPMYGSDNLGFTHEIGHSLDFNFENGTNQSSFTKFKETYEKELKKFIAAGGKQYSDDDDKTDLYPTKDCKEMFAEFYTILMLGESSYDYKTLIENFPETFENAKKQIKHIRSLPVEVRNKDCKK